MIARGIRVALLFVLLASVAAAQIPYRPWSPTRLPGLVIGAEADMTDGNLKLSGSNVTDWGYAHLPQFRQTNDSKRYTLVADRGDGFPELTMDGISDAMSIPSLTLSSNFTEVAVFRNTATSAMWAEHGPIANSSNGFFGWLPDDGDCRFALYRDAGGYIVFDAGISTCDTNLYQTVIRECYGTKATHTAFVDGVPLKTNEGASGTDPGISDVTETLWLGSRTESEKFMAGAYRAYFIYSPRLSTAQRQRLEKYVADKWTTFTPAQIAGLKIWAEADMTGDNLKLSGSKVTDWGSVGNPQFVQSTDSKRYTLVADGGDGLPELTMDGVDDFMSTANVTLSSSFTEFIVFRNTASSAMLAEHGPQVVANAGYLSWVSATGVCRFGLTGTTLDHTGFDTTETCTDDVYRVLVRESNGTKATHLGFINGVLSKVNETGVDPGVADVTDTLWLTSRAGIQQFLDGALRAYIVYNPMLSAADRVKVTDYLNSKWGVY